MTSAVTAPSDINDALIAAVKTLVVGIPTGWPLKDFTPPADTLSAQMVLLSEDRYPSGMGDGGDDRWDGIMQLDFRVPENDGPKRLSDKIGLALDYFYSGRVLTKNGQEVKIRRSSPSPIRKDGASYVKSVSVYWSSWTQR